MKFFRAVTTFVFAFLICGPSLADQRPQIGLTVAVVQDSLKPLIESEITQVLHAAGIDVSDRLPPMEIIIFASQDVNDGKNTNGVSIAFAFTSNVNTQQLVVAYTDSNQEQPEQLIDLLRGHGELLHLNVAHADAPSKEQIRVIANHIVKLFEEKYLTGR